MTETRYNELLTTFGGSSTVTTRQENNTMRRVMSASQHRHQNDAMDNLIILSVPRLAPPPYVAPRKVATVAPLVIRPITSTTNDHQ